MKIRLIPFLIILFVLAIVSTVPVQAQSNLYSSTETSRAVERSYPMDPAIKLAGRNAVFDKLVKKEFVSLGTAKFICPNDTVSTNTASIAYMSGVVPPCKIVVTPYDISTASITYDIYNVTAAGVTAPDTTCPLPLTNGRFEHISLGMPNLIFGASATGSATVEIYVPSY